MLCDVVHEASYFMQRDFGEVVQLQSSRKGPRDFTNKCYDRIKYKLTKSFAEKRPDYPVITSNDKKPQDGDFFILIEPISGIDNFSHSIPFCAIAGFLFDRKLDEPIAAIIHNPILRESFYGARGLGAWFENYNETIVPKSRMRVSNQDDINNAYIVADNYLNLGCDLLEIAYLAAARFDILVKKDGNLINEAALLLIKEAGGSIHSDGDNLLLSNGMLHDYAINKLL